MHKPPRILAVCQGGNVRSVTLRFLLNYRYGFDALACGLEPNTEETRRMLYEWAAIIIVCESSFVDLLPEDMRPKANVFDIGPDVWGGSLHPELIDICDDLIQQWIAAHNKAAQSRMTSVEAVHGVD